MDSLLYAIQGVTLDGKEMHEFFAESEESAFKKVREMIFGYKEITLFKKNIFGSYRKIKKWESE